MLAMKSLKNYKKSYIYFRENDKKRKSKQRQKQETHMHPGRTGENADLKDQWEQLGWDEFQGPTQEWEGGSQ